MSKLTHLDERGHAAMVDVSAKDATVRSAVARGEVRMAPATLAAIRDGAVPKGDLLAAARIAGILAAKRTPDLIPLCHPLLLSKVAVEFTVDEAQSRVVIEATVRCTGQTGVEMEALTAVSVAALTIYDMAKALEKTMVIGDICLVEKHGGKSGDYISEQQISRKDAKAQRESEENHPMSKYAPLQWFLENIEPGRTELVLTFERIEQIIGAKLPPSAHEYDAWWENPPGNSTHVQGVAWVSAGWRAKADRNAQKVTFKRVLAHTE